LGLGSLELVEEEEEELLLLLLLLLPRVVVVPVLLLLGGVVDMSWFMSISVMPPSVPPRGFTNVKGYATGIVLLAFDFFTAFVLLTVEKSKE
jgi:hypothetical protein